MPSDGPRGGGTTTSGTGTGDVSWDTGDVFTEDGLCKTASLGPFQTTKFLPVTNFGFTIPSGATIDGIVVEWKRKMGSVDSISDDRVRIIKADTVGATDRAAGGNWPTSLTYASYGSSSDLWGETWTDTDVNDAGFGAALAAVANTGGTASVDYVRITVYYTPAGGGRSPGRQTVIRRPDLPTDPQFTE